MSGFFIQSHMGQNKTERVGVLGGTFDPVHNGHLGIAAEARETFDLDRVLFVPANISPHKQQRTITAPHHRVNMLRLGIQSEPAFTVSEIEIERAGVSYTVDTLKTLETLHPTADLFLIVGIDSFKDMGGWKNPRRLLECYNIIIGTRPGHALENLDALIDELSGGGYVAQAATARENKGGGKNRLCYQHCRTGKILFFFEITPYDVSSSEIRRNVRYNKEIKNMLPPEVEHYIIKHQLYQAEPSPLV